MPSMRGRKFFSKTKLATRVSTQTTNRADQSAHRTNLRMNCTPSAKERRDRALDGQIKVRLSPASTGLSLLGGEITRAGSLGTPPSRGVRLLRRGVHPTHAARCRSGHSYSSDLRS